MGVKRHLGRLTLRQAVLVFVGALMAYGLVAYDRVKKPTAHLHFVDLAHSFLNGELETQTPKVRCKSKASREGPAGFDAFICAATKNGKQGLNDWSSYHEITTKARCSLSLTLCRDAESCPEGETCEPGDQFTGVWPWGDTKGSDRDLFRTLDGTLYVVERDDVARDTRHYFISFPPMPAVLMMPLVAIFDYNVNDVIFTLLFAAANVLLMLILLERLTRMGKNTRSLKENLIIAVLIGFGTSLFFSSVRGEVWFTALVIGFFFNVLFVCFSLETRHPLLAGAMLAFGMATRTPLAFACVFFAFELLRLPGWSERIKKGLWFSAPILVVGGLLMAYNMARFDSPFEFGHTYLMDGQRPSIRNHGLFHFRFLNRNLSAAFTNFPVLTERSPYVLISRHGLGIFVATPAFLVLLWPKTWKPVMTSALAAIIAVAIPGLFYQNTGWAQFSYRFSIDFLPFIGILLACGARPFNRKFQALVAASIVICLFGAITFGRFGEVFYYG